MRNDIDSKLSLSETDFWHQLPREVKQALNEAKGELDNGKGIPHDEIMTEVTERFLTTRYSSKSKS